MSSFVNNIKNVTIQVYAQNNMTRIRIPIFKRAILRPLIFFNPGLYLSCLINVNFLWLKVK
jgi:hypothetical protein